MQSLLRGFLQDFRWTVQRMLKAREYNKSIGYMANFNYFCTDIY